MKTLTTILIASALAISSATPSYAAIEQQLMAVATPAEYINAEVIGSTVTLTGYVESDETRTLAEELARNNGYEVVNYLIVSVGGGVGFF